LPPWIKHLVTPLVASAQDEISLRKWSGGSAHLRTFRAFRGRSCCIVVENALCWQQCFFFTHASLLINKPGVGKVVKWKSHLQKMKNTSESQNQLLCQYKYRKECKFYIE